jgi:hypothetical protein
LSTLICIITLVELHLKFFDVPEKTAVKAFDESLTWVLLILSNFFFTVGSWVFIRYFLSQIAFSNYLFVFDRATLLICIMPMLHGFCRAFKEPIPPPLLPSWRHFRTDELLGSWLFFIAMLPAIPYSLVFIKYNPHRMAYWGVFFAALLSVGASGFFVYTSYPSTGIGKDGEIRIVSPYIVWMMGKNSRIRKHVETDWLAACWFFYWSSWLLVLGSYLLLCMADNDRQIFVYLTR